MDIIKYFYEEPTLLETLTPDDDPDARRQAHRSTDAAGPPSRQALEDFLATPDYHRGYLAGTNRTANRVGLTAIEQPAAFVEPLWDGLHAGWWARAAPDGTVTPLEADAARAVLRDPAATAVLVTATAPVAEARIAAVVGTARRRALPALRALLAAARVVFFPEPAHDGFDWSFFSAHPMRDSLVAAFKQYPAPAVRRFVLPYQKARSESKFYFETWQLEEASLPAYIEEV